MPRRAPQTDREDRVLWTQAAGVLAGALAFTQVSSLADTIASPWSWLLGVLAGGLVWALVALAIERAGRRWIRAGAPPDDRPDA